MLNIILSVAISLAAVLGSLAYTEKLPSLGANTKISDLTAKTTLQGDDTLVIVDNSGTPTTKKITVTNATTSEKGYWDSLYEDELNNSAGLAAALSDEEGTGVAVFSSGANLTNATMTTPGITVTSDATGDMWYRLATGKLARLGVCSANQAIGASGGVPACISVVSFPYTASSTFTATTTHSANVVIQATGGLSVGFEPANATTSGNLIVNNNASTTNLLVSRQIDFSSGSAFNGWASSTAYEISTATDTFDFNTSNDGDATATCAAGKVVLGGGVGNYTGGNQTGYYVQLTAPVNNNSWRVLVKPASGNSATTMTVYAICVRI